VKHLENQRGAVLIFVTLMIVLLLIMVGLGLDTGSLTYSRNQGQAAVDAAALSAVTGLPSRDDAQVKSRAAAYNSKNDYVGSAANQIGSTNVSYVNYDFASNTITNYSEPIATANGVRVALEGANSITTPMFLTPLMNLLGITTAGTQNVKVSAIATITAKPAIPIALWQGKCAQKADANEDACWTTFFDCSSGAPDIKAGFQTASTCSGNALDGNVALGSMICQNAGQVNTVMNTAQNFFLDTQANAGKWWIIPVIKGSGNCAVKDPTAIVDFAKVQVTAVSKTGNPKYITANIQCGQSLSALDESFCFTHRLVREPSKGY
jgi:Flp pilus assembly protein TadG